MAAHPFVDGHGATVEKAFVLLVDFLFVPVGMVGFHELDHPEACEGVILRSKSGEVAPVEKMVYAGDNRKEAHVCG